MIRTLMGATAALALVASAGAFAATTSTAPVAAPQPQTQTQNQAQAAAQPAKVHKTAMRHRDRDAIGDRETAALNSLEASGYYTVKDIHPDGKNIVADAKKPGADFTQLTVRPDGTVNPAT